MVSSRRSSYSLRIRPASSCFDMEGDAPFRGTGTRTGSLVRVYQIVFCTPIRGPGQSGCSGNLLQIVVDLEAKGSANANHFVRANGGPAHAKHGIAFFQ